MLETFVVTAKSELGLKESADWCRSAESRKGWPGTRNVVSRYGSFFYDVEMRAPGASESLVTVEEQLHEARGDEHQVTFESGQLWSWPTEEVVSAWAEYRITHVVDGTQIEYRQGYMVPGNAVRMIVNRARYARSVERAAQRYVERLAQGGRAAGGEGSAVVDGNSAVPG